jgi:hypothetical protein
MRFSSKSLGSSLRGFVGLNGLAKSPRPDLQFNTLNPTEMVIRFPCLPSDSLFTWPRGAYL